MGTSGVHTALVVVPVANLAGVARHVLDLTAAGIDGWRFVVTAPEGPLLHELRHRGQAVVASDIGPEVPTARAVRALRDVLRRVRPDVAHSHLARADILLALASVGTGVRLVSTEHHISPDPQMFHGSAAKTRVMQAVHHLRIRRFDALMAVSESTRRDMLAQWKPTRDVVVVRNGVDRAATGPRPAGLRLLSLARLSPEKNIDMALRAFALVRDAHPGASLTIAGEGTERDRLTRLAGSLGVADAVTFAGFVDAGRAMADHDVIVQPSRSDNLSYTLLDAVAHGMGVVASPVGGNPEILPEKCLAALDDDADFAAKVVEQGLDVTARPVLGNDIPTVRGMADQVGAVYEAVTR